MKKITVPFGTSRQYSFRYPKMKLLFTSILVSLALAGVTRAVDPPPDGGYPNGNTAEGDNALLNLTSGTDNTAIGFKALYRNIIGSDNTAVGFLALLDNDNGHGNTAIGSEALLNNTSSQNTAIGFQTLFRNSAGSRNTAIGSDALYYNRTGVYNTAAGVEALFNNTTGFNNTALGADALYTNTTGWYNTAIGFLSLYENSTGNENVAEGRSALYNNTTGSGNIALGFSAGVNLTTGDNNVDIGNSGVAGESGTIRIGASDSHTATFVAGISGATVPTGVAVIVDTNGHLGTTTSSERFKEAIKPMDKASEAILSLNPVTFHYKKHLDPTAIPQFGLIAEEVDKVNPDLVARDDQGKPYSVRYEAVNAMLLNEFLKEHRKGEQQDRKIDNLETTVVKLESALAEQKKQVEALTARLEQVSVELELSDTAPKNMVNN